MGPPIVLGVLWRSVQGYAPDGSWLLKALGLDLDHGGHPEVRLVGAFGEVERHVHGRVAMAWGVGFRGGLGLWLASFDLLLKRACQRVRGEGYKAKRSGRFVKASWAFGLFQAVGL